MKLHEIITHVDNVKPNPFRPEEKVVWLNELEYSVQTDTLDMMEDMIVHTWSGTWSGTGLTFPDEDTVVIPEAVHFNVGGKITLSGCSDEGNNVTGVKILAVAWGDSTTTLTVAKGTFTTGENSETVNLVYDGREEEMVLPEQWHKVYYTYLLAQVEWNEAEYNAYANTMQMYNAYWGEYQRWYARNYIDPED